MIIDKKVLIIAIAAIVVVLALIGVALLGNNDNGDDMSALDILGDDEPDEEDEEDQIVPSKYYRIVIASNSEPEIADKAYELEIAIEQYTGFECGVVHDTQISPERTDLVEILIGKTNRNAGAVALEGVRVDDYVCKWIDGSLIIGGLSNSATLTALERFIEEILPYATAECLMSEELEFSYRHDYKVDSMKLCGFYISSYSIVCSDQAFDYARILKEGIAAHGGYDLDLAVRSVREGVKEIVIFTDSSLGDCAYAAYDGEDVVIKARDLYGLSVAFESFYNELLCGDTDKVSVTLSEQIAYPYVSPNISVMSMIGNIRAEENSLALVNDIISKIKTNVPDVVVLGKSESGISEMIALGLPPGYAYKRITLASGGDLAILYRIRTVDVTVEDSKENGMSVVQMRVKHIASDEEYQAIILAGGSVIGVDAAYDVLFENVIDVKKTLAVVLPLENNSNLSKLAQMGLLTKYNSCLSIGNSDYRTAILHGATVTCGSIDVEYHNSRNLAFVTTTLGKLCCEGAQNILIGETLS